MSLNGRGRKRKGSRRELQYKHLLESQGWSCGKAGGSLGMWDLFCTHPDFYPRLVQVKSNRKAPREEMDAMIAFRAKGCRKELVIWKDRQPNPVVIIL